MKFAGLSRPEQGRVLGGVCAALAQRWAIDVQLLRLAFVLLALASGLGILIYLALWLVWPSESGGPGKLWAVIRGNASELRATSSSSVSDLFAAWTRSGQADSPWPRSRRWLGIGLVAAGVWLFLGGVGMFAWLGPGASFGLFAVLVGLALIKSVSSRVEEGRR